MNTVFDVVAGYLLMFVVPLLLPALFVKLVGIEGLRNMFAYEPKRSVVHELDPRIKVLYPVVVGICSVMLQWTAVWVVFGLTLLPWVLVRPSPQRLRILATMAGVPVIGMIWSQGLFHAAAGASQLLFVMPPELSWFGTKGLSTGGLLFALQEAGRMLDTVSASLLLLITTTPTEFVWAFERFRLPSQLGFAFSAALRFYRANRGSGPRAVDVSTFFKRRALDRKFASFWQGSRNPARRNFDATWVRVQKGLDEEMTG